MSEPTALASSLAQFIDRHEPGSPMRDLGIMLLRTHGTNQDRRAAVLKHPDLAKRLTQPPLNFQRAEHWTGFIPPPFVNLGEPELLRSVSIGRDGTQTVRFNQLGHRTEGEQPNTDPSRPVLLEISAEAWRRENNPEITANNQPLSPG